MIHCYATNTGTMTPFAQTTGRGNAYLVGLGPNDPKDAGKAEVRVNEDCAHYVLQLQYSTPELHLVKTNVPSG